MRKKAFDLWGFVCLIYPTELCGLAFVDTWRFSKKHNHLITLYHNPANFNGHWHCKTGDAQFWATWLDGCSQLDGC